MSPEFIGTVEGCIGGTYLVEVPSDTLCWLRKPMVIKKQYRYRGELRVREVLEEGAKKPFTVQTLAKSLNDFYLYCRKVSEGTKRSLEHRFTKRGVVLSGEGRVSGQGSVAPHQAHPR